MNMAFTSLDWGVLVVYLAIVFGVGAMFTRRQHSTREFFTAGQRMHWLPVAISILASIFSAVSFIGQPARAYKTDCVLFAFALSVILITPVVVYVLLPFYRRLGVTSAYEYLEKRFGLNVRLIASALFIAKRLFWMALVCLAPAMALSAVTGLRVEYCVLIIGVLATIYTGLGGMAAVIWTDVIQFVVLMAGQILIIGTVASRLDGGLAEIWRIGVENRRIYMDMDVNIFSAAFWTKLTFITMLISGCFLALSDLGADQVIVQRLMTAKDEKSAARSLWANAVFKIPAMIIILGVGIAIFAFYHVHPELMTLKGKEVDKIVPFFTMTQLPAGISGLVIAAIFAAAMSSFDSGLNCLSTALTVDWYDRLGKRGQNDQRSLFMAKLLTYVLGGAVSLASILIYWTGIQGIIDMSNTYLGFFGGALLGVFLLGMLTRRAQGLPTVIGVLVSVALLFALDMYQKRAGGAVFINTYFYSVISCLGTMIIGYCGSLLLPPPAPERLAGLTLRTSARHPGATPKGEP